MIWESLMNKLVLGHVREYSPESMSDSHAHPVPYSKEVLVFCLLFLSRTSETLRLVQRKSWYHPAGQYGGKMVPDFWKSG